MLEMETGNKKRKISARRAFTMLEVMVAFTILAVGVIAIVPVTVFMVESNIHNKHFAQARLIAEQYSESLRTLDYENILLADDGDTTDAGDVANPDHSDTLVVDNTEYTVNWNIKTASSPQGMKEINIIIVWKDPASNRQKQLTTLAFKAAVSR